MKHVIFFFLVVLVCVGAGCKKTPPPTQASTPSAIRVHETAPEPSVPVEMKGENYQITDPVIRFSEPGE